MSGRTFDQLLADAEEQLWQAFSRARAKQHRGSRGASREAAVARFLRGQLPARFGVTTGEAIDAQERRTGQLDVVIYDRNVTAPLLAEESGDLLAAESLLAVIEVKSTLTKAEIEKCAKAARAVARLRPYGKSFIATRQAGSAADDGRCRCQFSVVAFSSNLSATNWCEKEWKRIKAAVATERISVEQIDRVLVLDSGILVPPSSTGRTAPDGKEMLREWFLHMSNFLIREADRRPAFDLQNYARRARNPGWRKLG